MERHGWTTGTDVQPMIRYTDDPTAFGAGEPSIVVLDGTIYFYYSWNDSGTGIKTRLATADATDPAVARPPRFPRRRDR